MTQLLLEARDVTVRFGGLVAVDNAAIEIATHQIRGLIGPNGAGKTTLFNAISGLVGPVQGTMLFNGADVMRMPAHDRAAAGMRRTFQSVQLVPQFTVLENVLVGMQTSFRRASLLGRLGLGGDAEATAQAAVRDVLEFLGIGDAILRPVNQLTFAEQRLTEIARAIVSRPKLLLLDEPAAGLSPNEVLQLGRLLRQLRDEWGITILLVEHVLSLVLEVSDRITVLENGRVIAEGAPAEVAGSDVVKAAYLGADDA
jgi:branched-chain amino acid transport system ATP-binding protein